MQNVGSFVERGGCRATPPVRFLLALSLLAMVACGEDDKTPTPDACSGDACEQADGADAADTTPTLPDPVCTPGTRWTPGTPVFRDATADWGLVDIGAVGTRVNVSDIDGDGFPDLLLRVGGTRLDDLDAGQRTTWLLRNTGAGGFEDFTLDSGIAEPRVGHGFAALRPIDTPAFADVDNDGDLDVYTGITTADPAVSGGETSELMRNSGGGFFSFTADTHALRRPGEIDAVAGASFVDVNRDGNIDLWLAHHNASPPGQGVVFLPDRLFLGNGDGTFTEATDALGLTTLDWEQIDDLNDARAHSRAWSSTACDLNNDGWPELMAASYGRAPNHLWQATPDGAGAVTYQNRSVESGYAYDNNRSWQDNQFARCHCVQFPTDAECAGVPAPQIGCQANWTHTQDREAFRLGGNSGTTVCADLDNDGWLDLLTTEIRHWWAGDGSDGSRVLRNLGNADVTFAEMPRADIGLEIPHVTQGGWDEGHMTAAIFDFDNDGWKDIYIGASDYAGNRGLLFHQTAPMQFTAVPIADWVEHNRSHGVAWADLDLDGDLDLIVGHSRARCDASQPNNCYETSQFRILENVLGDQGNWVQIDPWGATGTNRAALGARVEVTTPDDVTQVFEIGGGHGHYGTQNDRVVHAGLGEHCAATVTVRWPDATGSTDTFEVVAGHRFRIVQGEAPTWDEQ